MPRREDANITNGSNETSPIETDRRVDVPKALKPSQVNWTHQGHPRPLLAPAEGGRGDPGGPPAQTAQQKTELVEPAPQYMKHK